MAGQRAAASGPTRPLVSRRAAVASAPWPGSALWRYAAGGWPWPSVPPRSSGRRLCDEHAVEVTPADGALEGLHDTGRVVVRTLHDEGLAVAAEAERAGARPWLHVPGGRREVGVGLEAELARIR